MKEYVIDCSKIDSEQEFWNAYLNVVKPEGTEYFGRNLDAFWDALSAGGPGWPGNDNGCKIRFINTETIKMLRNGKFYSVLKEIEKNLISEGYGDVRIEIQ